MIYLDQIMRFRLKILISALILFFSFEILEIKAHNTSNEACKDFCFNLDDFNLTGISPIIFFFI